MKQGNSAKFEKAKIMKLQLDVTTCVSNEQYGTGRVPGCNSLNDSMSVKISL